MPFLIQLLLKSVSQTQADGIVKVVVFCHLVAERLTAAPRTLDRERTVSVRDKSFSEVGPFQ